MSQPSGPEYYGVVSLLDGEHEQRVLKLWEGLERDFGLRIRETHIPHFTYHSAQRYDLDRLDGILRLRAAQTGPFSARCEMLGVIRAPEVPCFFLPLVRNAELDGLHRTLWPELSEIATGTLDRYAPDSWMATINLTPDIEVDLSAELVRYLLRQDLPQVMRIDNLSLLHDTGTKQELAYRLELGPAPPLAT